MGDGHTRKIKFLVRITLVYKHNCIAMQSRADSIVKHARDCIARRIALQLCLYTISRAAKQGEKNKSHDTFWASEMIRAIYNNKYGLICFFNVVNERFRLMLESV